MNSNAWIRYTLIDGSGREIFGIMGAPATDKVRLMVRTEKGPGLVDFRDSGLELNGRRVYFSDEIIQPQTKAEKFERLLRALRLFEHADDPFKDRGMA